MLAKVHTSLPPRVEGATKGYLLVHLKSLVWDHSIQPPSQVLAVKLVWWGEDEPGTLFRIPIHTNQKRMVPVPSGNAVKYAKYQVKAAMDRFMAYLNGGL